MSVGLAYGHVLAPLGGLRKGAEDAKKLAKQGADGKGLRDALGIAVSPRSGAARLVVDRWHAAGPDQGAGVELRRANGAVARGFRHGPVVRLLAL
jgi:hypothetical protein